MSKYKMSIDFNVLNHLGINLYTNIPAVLSEVVANSYDADATNVDIIMHENEVIISDNGTGMTEEDINNKYLLVGYQKRKELGERGETPIHRRKVMGRKGIGKLSLMSIANIIEVYTVKNGTTSAFRINVADISELIKSGSREPYTPNEIDFDESVTVGTKIVLKEIRNNRTLSKPQKIKTELARRFVVLNNEFTIRVNGEEISFADRKYFDKVIKIFRYGNPKIDINPQLSFFDDALQIEDRDNKVVVNETEFFVEGWIGYVAKSDDLKEGSYSLNKISLLTNGKLGQEDILQELHNTSMFTNYVIGEIEANFLDGEKDLATSNREGYQKDCVEYDELFKFLQTEIRHIGIDWNRYKENQGVAAAIEVDPKISPWYERLQGDEKNYAKKILGKINTLITDEAQRKDFTKYGILAFEKMRLRKNLSAIENFDEGTIESLPKIFQGINDLEESMYYQIVKQRMDVIEKFEGITEGHQKEKVLQEYLYKNLWLLDPSWERPTSSESMEISLKRLFDEEVGLTDEEKKARLDIRFKNFAGKTVIVELKRYDRVVNLGEVVNQVTKYYDGISKILRKQQPERVPIFEIILLLGQFVNNDSSLENIERVKKALEQFNARVVYYDGLINDAKNAYSEYFNQRHDLNPILDIFSEIDE